MPIDLNAPLAASDPAIAEQIEYEVLRQHEGLEMIASENFVSRAVLEAAGIPASATTAAASMRT
jgi:glycine hydroxymethyltransferase